MLFGEYLVVNAVITREQLDEGLQFQKITKNLLGETLLEMAYIDRPTLRKYLEMHLADCVEKILEENTLSEEWIPVADSKDERAADSKEHTTGGCI